MTNNLGLSGKRTRAWRWRSRLELSPTLDFVAEKEIKYHQKEWDASYTRLRQNWKTEKSLRNKGRIEDQMYTNFVFDSLQHLYRGRLRHEVKDGFSMLDEFSTQSRDLSQLNITSCWGLQIENGIVLKFWFILKA